MRNSARGAIEVLATPFFGKALRTFAWFSHRWQSAWPCALKALEKPVPRIPLDTAPAPGAPSRCPYVSDPTSQPSSWAALHGRETASPGPMVAFNLLRIAGPAVSRRYQEFSAHFSDLPAKYGLKVLAAADVPPLNAACFWETSRARRAAQSWSRSGSLRRACSRRRGATRPSCAPSRCASRCGPTASSTCGCGAMKKQ